MIKLVIGDELSLIPVGMITKSQKLYPINEVRRIDVFDVGYGHVAQPVIYIYVEDSEGYLKDKNKNLK